MPYFDSYDTYINPYYLDVTPVIRAEMDARAELYASKTKTGILNKSIGSGKNIEWPYQKMPWGYVSSATYNKKNKKYDPVILSFLEMGKDGSNLISDNQGKLTIYESKRNVPNYPLLTGIEISNEGQRGSLLKGKFSFTFFPDLTPEGFELEAIQKVFFTPGNRVNIGFGWSVPAAYSKVNKLEFVGIIFGFNWSFNQNMSITAEVQIVSPSSISLGLSGDQSVFSSNGETSVIDPGGNPLPDSSNLLTVIEKDLRSHGDQELGYGQVGYLEKSESACKLLDYYKISLPISNGSSYEESSSDELRKTDQEKYEEDKGSIVETGVSGSSSGTGNGDSEKITDKTTISDKTKNTYTWAEAWNNKHQITASEQLYVFYKKFSDTNGDSSKISELVKEYTNLYNNGEGYMGRYINILDSEGKTVEKTFESYAKIKVNDIFSVMMYEKNGETLTKSFADTQDILRRKIAEISAQELNELMYGLKLQDGNSILSKEQEFYTITDENKKELKIQPYFWPDTLKFYTLHSAAGISTKDAKSKDWGFYWTIADIDKMVRKNKNSYLEIEKSGVFGTGNNWYIKNSDELKKTINSTIYNLEQFSKTGVNGNIKYNNDKKEVITKKREDGTATDENVQTMNRYVQELKDYRSFLKSYMFSPGNQDEIKSYPDNRWVGGFDMKTIRMNYLVEWKDPGVNAKSSLDYVNIIATSKWEHVISFINKLIDAREKERTSAVDKTNEFIKIKSSDYQEKINNQNQSSIDNNSGGSSGSTETETTGDASGYDGFSYRTYWYVRLGSLVEFANTLIDQFEEKYSTRYTFRKFKIVASNNEAEYLPNVKSAYPIDVYFPDSEMGSYNNFAPFYDDNTRDILRSFSIPQDLQSTISGTNIKTIFGRKVRVEDDVINIGQILIGVDYILKVYRGLILNNATNISYKSITAFFDEIIKVINAASGDMYQLTPHLFEEPERLETTIKQKKFGIDSKENAGLIDDPSSFSLISIEDTNLAHKHTIEDEGGTGDTDLYVVKPFMFEANVMRPLIKSTNISSRPPKEMAFAAYIAARGQEANEVGGDFRAKKAPPMSVDVNVTKLDDKDIPTHKELFDKNEKEKIVEESAVILEGFSEKWSERYRSILVKQKRLSYAPYYLSAGRRMPVGTHWLNKAIYPVDWNLTIDGINGFKFGDVLKTTLIPRHYNVDWDIVFTVTKLLHKVTPSIWETTLYTAARLSLDNPKTGITITGDPLPEDKNLPAPRT